MRDMNKQESMHFYKKIWDRLAQLKVNKNNKIKLLKKLYDQHVVPIDPLKKVSWNWFYTSMDEFVLWNIYGFFTPHLMMLAGEEFARNLERMNTYLENWTVGTANNGDCRSLIHLNEFAQKFYGDKSRPDYQNSPVLTLIKMIAADCAHTLLKELPADMRADFLHNEAPKLGVLFPEMKITLADTVNLEQPSRTIRFEDEQSQGNEKENATSLPVSADPLLKPNDSSSTKKGYPS